MPPLPPLTAAHVYLLFTPELCARDPWHTLERALAGGTDLVQWRPRPATRGREAAFRRCQELCAARGVPLVVNDDPALAARTGAAGAHVGQDDLPPTAARALLGAERWLGVSTHDTAQVRAATRAGADYLGFGPCYPTATKGYAEGLADRGLVRDALAATPLPVFAIGGVTPRRARALRGQGCARVAVCGAVLRADDPAAAVRALRDALGAPHSSSIASPNE